MSKIIKVSDDKCRSSRVWTTSGAKLSGCSPEAQYKLWKLNCLVE